MMKKLLFFFAFLAVALGANAQKGSATLDKNLSVKPGETIEMNVNLANTVEVQGFEAKVTLPEGLSFVYDEDNEAYGTPTERSEASFSGATLAGNTVTMAFLATKAKSRLL